MAVEERTEDQSEPEPHFALPASGLALGIARLTWELLAGLAVSIAAVARAAWNGLRRR
jgi:hypothetical protein